MFTDGPSDLNSSILNSSDKQGEITIDTFYYIIAGHIYFQALASGVQFNLFDILESQGPLTKEQIAEKLGIEDQPCRILLLTLATIGLLHLNDQKYSNSNVSRTYLVDSSPVQLKNVIKWQHFINYKAMYHFHESVVANKNLGLSEFTGTEPTLYQRLVHSPQLEMIFQMAMQDISRQAQMYLVENVDFSKVKYLVDVGGGNGSNIIKLAQQYPHLRASVFDSPSVCKIAQANIAKSGMVNRLSTVNGDCFIDAFPQDADCILFCHFFTIWSKDKLLELLTKTFSTLKSGGRVMIFNMMQNNSGVGPLSAAMGSPYFLTLATGTGMLYSWNEYRGLFEKAGFSDIQSQELPMDHGAIWGFKP